MQAPQRANRMIQTSRQTIRQSIMLTLGSMLAALLVTVIVLNGQPGVAAIMLTALIWILIAIINVVYATRQRPHQ